MFQSSHIFIYFQQRRLPACNNISVLTYLLTMYACLSLKNLVIFCMFHFTLKIASSHTFVFVMLGFSQNVLCIAIITQKNTDRGKIAFVSMKTLLLKLISNRSSSQHISLLFSCSKVNDVKCTHKKITKSVVRLLACEILISALQRRVFKWFERHFFKDLTYHCVFISELCFCSKKTGNKFSNVWVDLFHHITWAINAELCAW